MREDKRKELGLKPDGDHVYYVTAKLCNETNKNETEKEKDLTFMAEDEDFQRKKSRKMLDFTNSDVMSPPKKTINEEYQEIPTFTPKKNNNKEKTVKNKGKTAKNKEKTMKNESKTVKNDLKTAENETKLAENNNFSEILTQRIENNLDFKNNNLDFKNNLEKIQDSEQNYIQTQNFPINEIKNDNILTFSLNSNISRSQNNGENEEKDVFSEETDKNETKFQGLERKRIIFEDIDNKILEIPHSFSVTHEFSSKNSSEKLDFPTKNHSKSLEKQENPSKNLNFTIEIINNQSNPNKDQIIKGKSMNSIENHNILDLESSLNILNSLANKTLSSMSSLSTGKPQKSNNSSPKKSNPFDIFKAFRFQDLKKTSFLQFPNINNANTNNMNVISNTNIISDISMINCSENSPCPGPNNNSNETKTHLAYYDVKHPSTHRIIDRNKGTVTTITDLGSVTKTIVMNPDDIDDYLEVEHKLDKEFNQSDSKLHYNSEAQSDEYNKPYDIGDILDNAENIGSTEENNDNSTNKTDVKYKYKTKIEVNSPKQFLIKRVQTNNKEGIKVNNRSYDYGKTMNNYSFDDVYEGHPDFIKKSHKSPYNDDIIANFSSKTAISIKEISNITNSREISNEANGENCCSIEPCHYLRPCVKEKYKENVKKAYIANSFLQIKKKNKFLLRKRSRFPTPQYECVQRNLKEIVDYLCNQEISSSYQKYCKVIREMVNIVIEGLLYRDSIENICSSIKMCH